MTETTIMWLTSDRPWWRDGLFLGFLAFAAAVSSHSLLGHRRCERALSTTEACLALKDVSCVSEALNEARLLDAENPRVLVAECNLHILLGELGAAASALSSLEVTTAGNGPARGDFLLAQGDYAEATGQFQVAQERYLAAKLLVDESSLVRPRLQRLTRQETGLLDDLRTQFEKLFDLANDGRDDLIQLQASDLTQRIGRLPDADARQQLLLAVSAAQRATTLRGTRRRADAPPASVDSPPVAPTPPGANGPSWLRDQYPQRQAEYARSLAAYESRRTAAQRLRETRAADTERTATGTVDKARELFEAGMETLRSALGAPADGKGSAVP